MIYLPGIDVWELLFHTHWSIPCCIPNCFESLRAYLVIIKPLFLWKRRRCALNQWWKWSRSKHIFFMFIPTHWRRDRLKRTWESSWRVSFLKGTSMSTTMYCPNSNQNFDENWYLLTIAKRCENAFLSHTQMIAWKQTLQLKRPVRSIELCV
jgi:hypothetical protein